MANPGRAALGRGARIVPLTALVAVVVILFVVPSSALGAIGPSSAHPASGNGIAATALKSTLMLAGLAAVAFVAGWARGAYAKEPPVPAPREPEEESPPWPLVQELDALRREERRVRHRLRQVSAGSPEAAQLRAELDRIEAEGLLMRARREEEYAR